MPGSRSMFPWRAAAGLLFTSSDATAQNADELAKQLSNPVASLISVPLQFNYDDGLGAGEGTRFLLNVQPVMPVSIGNDWNMISRTIVPLIDQEDILPDSGSQAGFGDVTQSLFFSPKAHTRSGWTWGVGPALLLRTASDDLLGSGKWGAGPTAVALKQNAAGWTYGALVNHLWSFAGDGDRAGVSSTFLQPFSHQGTRAGSHALSQLRIHVRLEGTAMDGAVQHRLQQGLEARQPNGQLPGRCALLPRSSRQRRRVGSAFDVHVALSAALKRGFHPCAHPEVF